MREIFIILLLNIILLALFCPLCRLSSLSTDQTHCRAAVSPPWVWRHSCAESLPSLTRTRPAGYTAGVSKTRCGRRCRGPTIIDYKNLVNLAWGLTDDPHDLSRIRVPSLSAQRRAKSAGYVTWASVGSPRITKAYLTRFHCLSLSISNH